MDSRLQLMILFLYKVRRDFFFGLTLLVSLSSCSENAKLEKLLDRHHDDFHSIFYEWQPPNPINISHTDSLTARIDFISQHQIKLSKIDSNQLNDFKRKEWRNFHNRLEEEKQHWQSYFHDPSLFDVTNYLKNTLLTQETLGDTLQYLQALKKELSRVPQHFERIKQIINQAEPDKANLAVQKQILFLRFLQLELPRFLEQSALYQTEKDAVTSEVRLVELAIKDFIGFCESLVFEHFEEEIRRKE